MRLRHGELSKYGRRRQLAILPKVNTPSGGQSGVKFTRGELASYWQFVRRYLAGMAAAGKIPIASTATYPTKAKLRPTAEGSHRKDVSNPRSAIPWSGGETLGRRRLRWPTTGPGALPGPGKRKTDWLISTSSRSAKPSPAVGYLSTTALTLAISAVGGALGQRLLADRFRLPTGVESATRKQPVDVGLLIESRPLLTRPGQTEHERYSRPANSAMQNKRLMDERKRQLKRGARLVFDDRRRAVRTKSPFFHTYGGGGRASKESLSHMGIVPIRFGPKFPISLTVTKERREEFIAEVYGRFMSDLLAVLEESR